MPDTKQLTPDEAYSVLVGQIHAPVFFEKLATVYNINPQNAEEAKELLMIAGQLRNAQEQDGVKQAGQRANFYGDARRNLSQYLDKQGYQPLVDDDLSVKNAADAAVQNPVIKEAALVFNHFLTNQLQQTN